MKLESYVEQLKKMDKAYQWPIETYYKRLPERKEVHKEFSHVVTYAGYYGSGGILETMENWCREKFGDRYGECHWRECRFSWKRWHEESGLEETLEDQLDICKDDEAHDIIDGHFDKYQYHIDAPGKHSHKGLWTTFFVVKTGYDYGYEDFCFQNKEDAVYFKLIWDEEVERRK